MERLVRQTMEAEAKARLEGYAKLAELRGDKKPRGDELAKMLRVMDVPDALELLARMMACEVG